MSISLLPAPKIQDYQLSSWEQSLVDKNPIIAPDGYVPNSVVRERTDWKPPPKYPSPLQQKIQTSLPVSRKALVEWMNE